jgi:glycosyltransferase involved in cell wall biosynthesis
MTHLLFFVAEDWYFYSHRLPLALAARDAGYKVTLVTQVHQHGNLIRAADINLIPIYIERGGLNPFNELRLIAKMYAIYRRERPDIVHHVAMKPVIYGTLAARMAKITRIVNALAGLGFVFSSSKMLARVLQPILKLVLRWTLNGNSHVIVQNSDDVEFLLTQMKISPTRTHLIYGAGVDLHTFIPTLLPVETSKIPTILFPARLLWDKGVNEFVTAAKILRERGLIARWVIAGAPDYENPAAVPQKIIESWVKSGLIIWLGHCTNMVTVLQQSHIVCLPSYREGLPKSLVEAAACGKAIVTTDTPGCREVVKHGENGLLVPIKNATALAEALAILIQNPKLRTMYGNASRTIAEAMFGSEQIIAATLAIYKTL